MPAVEHFDAVIVGSGFGGSVMAARLAEAGRRVCVLERGRAFPPGSFPRSVHGIGKSLWDPSKGLYGMWDMWSFSNFDAMVASGLGGGSLVYGNMLIRKPEKWFVVEDADGHTREWPVTRAMLDPHYDRVERVLAPQKFPFAHAPYDQVRKVRAFHDAATAMGKHAEFAPLSIHFAAPGQPPVPGASLDALPPNLHGLPRTTCTLCGECVFGCNTGAKNTLDYNYLSEAKLRHGAEVRALSEVKTFARDPLGWRVEGVTHSPDDGQPPMPFVLTTRRLVLSAGALGSPYLLLSHRPELAARGVQLSPRLGERVGGNGDLFMMLMGCEDELGRPRELDPGRGPAITSYIREDDALDGTGARGRGMYLEEAGIPDFFSWAAEMVWWPALVKRGLRFAWFWWKSRGKDADMSNEVSDLIGDGSISNAALPLLAMGRDVPTGKMSLNGKWLEIAWQMGPNQAYYQQLDDLARRFADRMGGEIKLDTTGKHRTFTVHPLGGCPMGHTADDGVVDSWGRVFDARGGVVDGLYVADGSVMPGPVGPNPSLTIAALADRFADGILAEP